eukprot:GDKJ01032446.1.p1 GENE.GDKJ01032446.1~~GDKJ01032446.1.p1  ORF type:complete len:657 (+),score=129.27 GDKJ01032446.1:108-1973(+)
MKNRTVAALRTRLYAITKDNYAYAHECVKNNNLEELKLPKSVKKPSVLMLRRAAVGWSIEDFEGDVPDGPRKSFTTVNREVDTPMSNMSRIKRGQLSTHRSEAARDLKETRRSTIFLSPDTDTKRNSMLARSQKSVFDNMSVPKFELPLFMTPQKPGNIPELPEVVVVDDLVSDIDQDDFVDCDPHHEEEEDEEEECEDAEEDCKEEDTETTKKSSSRHSIGIQDLPLEDEGEPTDEDDDKENFNVLQRRTKQEISKAAPCIVQIKAKDEDDTFDDELPSTANVTRHRQRNNHHSRFSTMTVTIDTAPEAIILPVKPPAPVLDPHDSNMCPGRELIGYKIRTDLGDLNIAFKLGAGGFGGVFAVYADDTPSQRYALKVVSKAFLSDPVECYKEISLHSRVNHKNIIKLFEWFEDADYLYLLMELAQQKNLFQVLNEKNMFEEHTTAKVIGVLARAVDHLHSCGIIHRDLKPDNILIGLDQQYKIADFGLSARTSRLKPKRTTHCGTLTYMAPEFFDKNCSHDGAVDVWALGVMMLEFLSPAHPFENENDEEVKRKIVNLEYYIPDTVTLECRDFIRRCLKIKPSERITAKEMYQHPWIQMHESPSTYSRPTCIANRKSVAV